MHSFWRRDDPLHHPLIAVLSCRCCCRRWVPSLWSTSLSLPRRHHRRSPPAPPLPMHWHLRFASGPSAWPSPCSTSPRHYYQWCTDTLLRFGSIIVACVLCLLKAACVLDAHNTHNRQWQQEKPYKALKIPFIVACVCWRLRVYLMLATRNRVATRETIHDFLDTIHSNWVIK